MAAPVLERKVLQVGERIFREGDPGNQAYIVQAGLVEIVKTMEGKETVLGTVGDGGIFGEMALIDDAPRMATARAANPTTIIIVNRRMFQDKLAKTDPFIRKLLNIFAQNIRAATGKGAKQPAVAGPPAADAEAGKAPPPEAGPKPS